MIRMGNRVQLGTKVKVLPSAGNYSFVKITEDELGYGTIVSIMDRNRYKIQFESPSDFVQTYMLFGNEFEIISPAPRGWKHPDAPTLDSVERFTEHLHGSGIDYGWVIEETNTSFRASNAYETMTTEGFYDSTVPFTVIFPKKASIYDFKLQFGSGSRYQVQKYMLRDYLEEQIALTLTLED